MKKIFILIAAAGLLLLSGCSRGQKTWITDLDEAQAEAAKTGKPVLIVFTGSDWNDQSKNLIENLFTPDFFATGSKEYVLCNIDILKNTETGDPETQERNYDAANKYAIQQLPYVVLMTTDMDIYGSFTTDEKTSSQDEFFTAVESYLDAKEKITTLKQNIASSEGLEKAGYMDTFMDSVSPVQRDDYRNYIEEIIELDSDASAGLKAKYLLQLQYLKAVELYQNGNMAEAGEGFFTVANSGILDAAKKQEALYMGTYMYAMSETIEDAQLIEWLQEAIAADPENPGVSQIENTIKKIQEKEKEE